MVMTCWSGRGGGEGGAHNENLLVDPNRLGPALPCPPSNPDTRVQILDGYFCCSYLRLASSSFLVCNQDVVLSGGTAVPGSLKARMQPRLRSPSSPPWETEEDYFQEAQEAFLQSFMLPAICCDI